MYKSSYLTCIITGIAQFVFCSSYTHMYLVFFRIVKTLHRTNSTDFLSLFDTHTFYQHFLSSSTDGDGKAEIKNRELFFISFSFEVIISSLGGSLRRKSKGKKSYPRS